MKEIEQRGFVYFLREEDEGNIKIGFTAGDPLVRLRECQTGNSRKLALLSARCHAPKGLETDLHWFFDAARLHGEWFRPNSMLVFLAEGRDASVLEQLGYESSVLLTHAENHYA